MTFLTFHLPVRSKHIYHILWRASKYAFLCSWLMANVWWINSTYSSYSSSATSSLSDMTSGDLQHTHTHSIYPEILNPVIIDRESICELCRVIAVFPSCVAWSKPAKQWCSTTKVLWGKRRDECKKSQNGKLKGCTSFCWVINNLSDSLRLPLSAEPNMVEWKCKHTQTHVLLWQQSRWQNTDTEL